MKRIICFLLAMTVLAVYCPISTVIAVGDVPTLSEGTDAEILAFVAESNIQIPEGFATSDADLAAMIRYWIELVEDDPDITFVYGHTDLQSVSDAVKTAVNAYYGTHGQRVIVPILPDPSYTLQYNTLYSNPSDKENYNCYAYALGRNNIICNPGYFTGNSLTASELLTIEIDELADKVENDLKSIRLGYSCVSQSYLRPTWSSLLDGESVICVRMVDNTNPDNATKPHDYHFMKLFENNVWRHKPGRTAILTYNSQPKTIVDWISEVYDDDGAKAGRYVYDSSIIFIKYAEEHSYGEPVANGGDYHMGGRHYYPHKKTCEGCQYVHYYNVIVNCDSCG